MPTKTVLETLVAARKLIEEEGSWIQGSFARTAKGFDLTDDDLQEDASRATSFCASGALIAASCCIGDPAYRLVAGEMGMSLSCFNDTHTHAEVLAAFDAAIAKARAEAK